MVILVGLASFALDLRRADYSCAGLGRRSHLVLVGNGCSPPSPPPSLSQFAMSLTGAVLTRRQSREVEQIRTAIDSMAQGLCMFDAAERLVVCNAQYYKMYELTPDDVKPGATLIRGAGETGRQGHLLARSGRIPEGISRRGGGRAHHRARGQVQRRPPLAGHQPSDERRRLDRHARGHHRAAAGRAATHDLPAPGRAPRRHRERDLVVPRTCRKSPADGDRQHG